MESITLEISNPETVNAISEAAKSQGMTPELCALELLETALMARKPFEEVVEPISISFDQSGMSEEEFDDLIEQVKQEVRAGRRNQE